MNEIFREEFLKLFPVFEKSPRDICNDIMFSAVRKDFKQGSYLYLEGDTCPGIGFLICGEIRVFKTGEGGREVTLYEIFPGETCILNASCILSNSTYPANALCLTDGSMLFVPSGIFKKLISSYEEMRTFIFTFFSQRFSRIIELVEEVTFGKMDMRLTNYLIEKSENGSLHTTHQTIANDLGTSREVVSRLLKDLERRGQLVLSRNRIQILNL